MNDCTTQRVVKDPPSAKDKKTNDSTTQRVVKKYPSVQDKKQMILETPTVERKKEKYKKDILDNPPYL